ncbi:Piwi-domain-containing protein [Neolentinus lepideus HHB14362 ss-1]|uniref:Piwi-domain-containing protein n=1 Tax=Neolentinus lepideus HHB14362 ss-1 TaxID=1314782 RepID=A0A165PB10_9AGAM|nr:Piwi-domain-containing protein [Neolentinus lepideus HHB14362 ss-1]
MIGIKTYIGNVYPLQFCHVAHAQLYKRSLPKWIQDEVISSSKTSPQERLKRIRQARLDLGYDNSPWIHESGLSIRPEPMSGIAARIIDPPTLHFHLPGHNSPRHSISPKNDTSWKGAWDVRARTFAVAGRIVNKVGLINFAGMKEQETQRFYRDLRSILHEHGIVIHDQNPFLQTQEPAGVDEEWLRHWVQYHPADLIIAILPTNAPDIYRTVKRFGDVEAGVVTQCVRHGKKFDNQYLNNLSLKINAKLGGVNNYASGLEIFQQKNVIVFGADVSRPAAGLQPAIASVVSSWDDYGCQYMAQISIQPPQQEIISDLQKMVYEAVRFYFSQRTKRELPLSKRLPGAILFYRDGVSEGEYAAIAKEEIGSIRRALQQVVVEISERFNLQPPPQIPKLTFIVVGKRHHIRFFPDILSPQDPMNAADQTGNCRPGLVVDRDVTNPTEYNFYLQSHAALRNSTSRSSHYIVILDAINISPDLLQSISYALCHVYARASRSVSRPAPVYYADLVCRRARFHFDTEVATHLDYASDASGDQPFNIEHWKSHFKDIHVGMKGMMYFV